MVQRCTGNGVKEDLSSDLLRCEVELMIAASDPEQIE